MSRRVAPRPADRAYERPTGLLEQVGRRTGWRAHIQRGHDSSHPAIHVRAVIGIANGCIQLGQQIPVSGDPLGELAQPAVQRRCADRSGHCHTPRRAIGRYRRTPLGRERFRR
jgi:hypothetical protein